MAGFEILIVLVYIVLTMVALVIAFRFISAFEKIANSIEKIADKYCVEKKSVE